MNPKKLLLVGDLHIKLNNLEVASSLFGFINSTIKSENITDLVLLGDVYDTKAIIRSEVQNFVLKTLQDLVRQTKVDIHIVIGNHDYENLECSRSALEPLDLLEKVSVYSHLTVNRELNCAFIPFRPTNAHFLVDIENIQRSSLKSPTIFCHQGISGFDLGNGIIDKTGINLESLGANSYVIGHYHKFQHLNNVLYLGTPFSHSFGEANQDKKIAIYKPDTKEVSFIDTRNIVRQYYRLTFIAKTDSFDDASQALLPLLKSGDNVEVIICCLSSELKNYSADWIVDKLGISGLQLAIKFDLIHTDKTVRLKENSSLDQLLHQYLSTKERSDLLGAAMKFLSDASV